MATELPKVVAEFEARVEPYIRKMEQAARSADKFGDQQQKAEFQAKRMGVAAKEAADKAARSQALAAEAAEKLAKEEISQAKATQIAERAARDMERAEIKQAEATYAAGRAADFAAEKDKQLALAQRLAAQAADKHAEELRELAVSARLAGRESDGLRHRIRGLGAAVAQSGSGMSQVMAGTAATMSSNWVIAIGIVAAAFATLPAAAVLAAGGIVAALGGALAGIGVFGVLLDKKMRKLFGKMFSDLGAEIKRGLIQISKPFLPAINTIERELRRLWIRVLPELNTAFKRLGPEFDRFLFELIRSFDQLRPAIRPITDAFIALMRSLGPQMPTIMRNIAQAIIMIANTVKENPDLFGKLLSGLTGLLPKAAQLIDKLVQLADWIDRNSGKIERISFLLLTLVSPVTTAIRVIGALRTAAQRLGNAFERAKQNVENAMNRMHDAVMTRVNRVRAIFRSLPGWIRAALGGLGGLLFPVGTAIVQGLINGIRAMIPNLIGAVSPIAGIIARYKGPLDKDARLLTPHGRAVMSGLMAGIQARVPDLVSQLRSITAMVAAPAGPGVFGPGLAMAGAGVGRGSTVVHNHVTNVNVEGSVIKERDLFDRMQQHSLRRNARNPSNMNSLPTGR